jgi:ElaB/YqjD/DUF883 family membrane-anchored ribosome-binding protein
MSMNDDDFAELFKKLSSGQSAGTSWQDVAAELESLGKTVSEVLRRAWQDTDTGAGMAPLREMVSAAINELNRAIDGTPEAVEARDQLADLRDNLRAAAEKAGSELRPELLNMLRQANGELRRRSGLDEST